jgi:hypothetical protein
MLLVNSSAIPDRQGKDQNAAVQATGKQDEHFSSSCLVQASSEITALHWAAENGQLTLVETLLQNGAPINAPRVTVTRWVFGETEYSTQKSETALHLAVENGHKATVSLLLDHRAGINDFSTETYTSFRVQSASKRQDGYFGNILDEHKTEYTEKKTAVHLAAEGGYKAIIVLLLGRGAKVYPVKREYFPIPWYLPYIN